MRIGQQASLTDPGRRRRRNEDAFVVDPPLFVVADGMGGAQAGEVAARIAAAAFREYHEADQLAAEQRIEAIIQEANRRIHERARADLEVSGMGTTVTAALVGSADVSIGHVGDSRAYRIRDGDLEQLTQDHTLVADLVRSGRLTAEEADTHPQRSVITRALGTDAEVDVDTFAVDARAGDVFLICSDGLTGMLTDEEILRVVRETDGLDEAVKELVKQANRRGGEDNVTVILFALAEGEAALEETARIATNGHAEVEDLEDTLTGLEAPNQEQTVIREPTGWDSPAPEAAPEPEAPPRTPERKARRGRRILLALVAVAFIAALLVLAFWGLANAHFVGAERDGRLAVYQGLPYDVGGGVSLYRARYVSELRASQLSRVERRNLLDHDLMTLGAARTRLAGYEAEGLP
jgi:serine/threonine protein phosphatase PrpC